MDSRPAQSLTSSWHGLPGRVDDFTFGVRLKEKVFFALALEHGLEARATMKVRDRAILSSHTDCGEGTRFPSLPMKTRAFSTAAKK